MENGEFENNEENEERPQKTSMLSSLKIPALFLIVIILSAVITNFIGSSFTGGVISSLESENQNLKSLISSEQQAEDTQKTNLEMENKNLNLENQNLENMCVESMNRENCESQQPGSRDFDRERG